VAVTKKMLLSELQDLLRLTAFEQTVAGIRRSQASSTPIAGELAANAEKAGERRALLSDAVRQLGGVPDVVGATLGRAGALVQGQLNQVQTLQGALLGDLALEHELRERARYARTLADSLGYAQVLPVLDRLDTAHTATIEWLETRLAEVGRTGTSAIHATPVQAAVTGARRVLAVPFGVVSGTVNRGSALLARKASTVEDVAADAGQRAAGQAKQKAEQVAGKAGQAADEVIDLAGADAEHPPFAAYDRLSGDSVMRHVSDTEDVDELRRILAFEQAHKDRKGVVQAAEARLAELLSPV
jgi:bacterioferritin (cytochrome b1)